MILAENLLFPISGILFFMVPVQREIPTCINCRHKKVIEKVIHKYISFYNISVKY